MKVQCRRPASVHLANATRQTSFGLTHRHWFIFSATHPPQGFLLGQICERAVCNSQRLKSREDFVPNCWRSGGIGYVREARPQEGGVSILVKTLSACWLWICCCILWSLSKHSFCSRFWRSQNGMQTYARLEPVDLGACQSIRSLRTRHEYPIAASMIQMAAGDTTVWSRPSDEGRRC
jgi:hypothetical protein